MMLYKYRSLSKAKELKDNIKIEEIMTHTHTPIEQLFKKSDYEKTIELLKNNELYFSAPEGFNDPFDCYLPPIKIQGKATWMQQALTLERDFGHRDPDIKNKVLTLGEYYNFDSESQPNKKTPKNAIDIMQNIINNRPTNEFRILSLSEVKDSILMWAHYADSFKGICLGFSTYIHEEDLEQANCIEFDEICQSHLNEYSLRIQKSLPCMPVIYNPDNTLPKDMATAKDNFFNQEKYAKDVGSLFRMKHDLWGYEKEQRIVTNVKAFNKTAKDHIKLRFKKNILKEIIFGFDCERNIKNKIKKIAKKKYKNVVFFRCKPKKYEYGIDIILDKEH